MKLFRIWQDVTKGYDTFDSAVVCADDEHEAKETHPNAYVDPCNAKLGVTFVGLNEDYLRMERLAVSKGMTGYVWTVPENVKTEFLGEAAPEVAKGVICASFNAG